MCVLGVWECVEAGHCAAFALTPEYIVSHVLTSLSDAAMYTNPDDHMEDCVLALISQFGNRLPEAQRCVCACDVCCV